MPAKKIATLNGMNGQRSARLFTWFAIGIAATVICLYFVVSSRTFQFFGKIVSRVHTERKVVALTFDDGPTMYTDSVLMVLEREHIQATFFVEGRELAGNVDCGRRIIAAGHDIGNHSYSHKRMIFTSPVDVQKEIETTDSLIRSCGYRGDIYFRPPYCKKFLTLPYYLAQHNRTTITWDVEPETGNANASTLVNNVLEHTKPGSIILLHCMQQGRSETRKALPQIIERLKDKGFEFVTVQELLSLPM